MEDYLKYEEGVTKVVANFKSGYVNVTYLKDRTNIENIKTASDREALANQERKFIDDRCAQIIALKREVCDTPDKSFVVINQKGIDPGSLAMLAAEGFFYFIFVT